MYKIHCRRRAGGRGSNAGTWLVLQAVQSADIFALDKAVWTELKAMKAPVVHFTKAQAMQYVLMDVNKYPQFEHCIIRIVKRRAKK